MSETTPATPPPAPATPAPRSPIDSFEALFRELVVAFATMQSNATSVPLPPGVPSSLPTSSSDVALASIAASNASLVPMNQRQLEILQASDAERKNRVLKDERDRDWRRMIILGLSAVVLGLEVYRAAASPAPAPAQPPQTIIVTPAPAASASTSPAK